MQNEWLLLISIDGMNTNGEAKVSHAKKIREVGMLPHGNYTT